MRDIHVVTGQTASGKTSYALAFAEKVGGVIISADSRQVYQKLDTITGKDIPTDSTFQVVEEEFPLDKERKAQIGYYMFDNVKVWGLDFIDPQYTFSSYDYTLLCSRIIQKYISESVLPIIVGGSYLYIKNLVYGFDVQVEPQWEQRKKLATSTIKELQDLLISKDPQLFEAMNHSDQQNPHRLMRKIEIAEGSSNQAKTQAKPLLHPIKITGLRFESTDILKQTIEKRVESRLKAGAVDEVKNLLSQGYSAEDPGMQTIGYKQLIMHLSGELSLDEAIQLWITAEIQYAKRQLTFIKADNHIDWIDV